jgi:hypothetical protein
MPRDSEPEMHDPQDRELHGEKGVKPYPAPNKTKVVGVPVPDESTSTPDNNFERADEDEDGDHLDAVDKMRKTLTEDGDKEAWKDGKTQGAPRKSD